MTLNQIIDLFNSSDPSDWRLTYFHHGKEVACLQSDVDLRIETSSKKEHCQSDDFREDWANIFPNPQAEGRFYDLYFRSTIITRFVLVHVDGGRVALPLPDGHSKIAPQSTYKVAQIFTQSPANLDQYMKTAGISVATIRDTF